MMNGNMTSLLLVYWYIFVTYVGKQICGARRMLLGSQYLIEGVRGPPKKFIYTWYRSSSF